MDEAGVGFETARLELARVRVDSHRQCEQAAQRAARVCSEALNVERVGVWLFEDNDESLRCWAQYTRSTNALTAGTKLDTNTFPTYCKALEERRALVADDARTNPLTCELKDNYLVPLGITSMLDAPIFRQGRVVGVVCHEHVGPLRHWTEREADFAGSVADMVGAIFEQAERSELESELRERAARQVGLEHLEQLSRVAQSVAHNFASVLTGISMIAEKLSQHESPWVADRGREIEQQAEVGAHLCAEINRLSQRRLDSEPRARVDDVLEGLRPLLDTLVRERGTLALDVRERGAEVAVRPTHLEQILMNLCLNSRDAIDRGGSILLRVRPAQDNEGGSSRVALEVSDDGCGMEPAVVGRIFDPYFSTKPDRSGLGLSTVQALVREYGGALSVISQVGTGALFTVILPRLI
jgi:signal transduction histidine kinase